MTNYDESWDLAHAPGDDDLWQESDCYWFYDTKQGIGGFHRIGRQPNRGKGQLTLFAFKQGGQRFVLSDGERTEVDLYPITPGSRRTIVGNHSVEALGGGRMRFIWDEGVCVGDLEFYEQFYTPRNWSKTGHSDRFMENINPDGHLECSGKLRGTLRIGDNVYTIDALAHRDRSWGFRDNSRVSMHRYRMFSGTVGPELSFACFLLDLKEGPKMVAGFVHRDGIDHDVRDLRVLVKFDSDGITPVSSTGIITLDNDETLRIETTSVQGFMTPVRAAKSASQDHISTFSYQGKTGFLDLELCTNPGRGEYIPSQEDVTFLAVDQGISAFIPYEY